jgi:hypothetical protein
MHEPIENDPANWPDAIAIVVFPNPDTDGWDAFYAFREDPTNYVLDALTNRNYDPMHDPYANHRSIGAEYDGSYYSADQLVNFAGFTGVPITFIPDITPGS